MSAPESAGQSLLMCTRKGRFALHSPVFGGAKSIGSSQLPARLHKGMGDSTEPHWNFPSFPSGEATKLLLSYRQHSLKILGLLS